MVLSSRKRVLSSLTSCLGGFSQGAMLSWSAPVIPQLSNPFRSEIGWVAENTISWIAAINFMGSMLGSLLAFILLRYLGFRTVIGLSSVMATLSWLTVGLADSAIMLILGRICLGCGNAILMSVIPSYIFTIAPPCSRGSLTCCYSLAMGLGLIFSVTIGSYLSWGPLSLASGVAPFFLFLSTPLLVSSPADDRTSLQSLVHPLTKPPTAKHPLALLLYLAVTFTTCGVCTLSVFPELLLSDQRTVDTDSLVIVSMICQLLGMLLGAFFIDRVGRKPVLQVGAWLTLLANILLSIYFSTEGLQQLCPAQPGSLLCWTPAVATCIFFLGFGGGLGSIFFVLMAEVVPVKKQTTIIPIITFILNFLQFGVIKSFIYVVQKVGLTNLFFIQAAVCLFSLIGQSAWVPETRVIHRNIASVNQDGGEKDGRASRRSYGTFVSNIRSFHRNGEQPSTTEFTLDHTDFHVTISDPRMNTISSDSNENYSTSDPRRNVSISNPRGNVIISDPRENGNASKPRRTVSLSDPRKIVSISDPRRNIIFSNPKGEITIIDPSGNVTTVKDRSNRRRSILYSPSESISNSCF